MKNSCDFCGSTKKKLFVFERVFVFYGPEPKTQTKKVLVCGVCGTKQAKKYSKIRQSIRAGFASPSPSSRRSKKRNKRNIDR